MHVFLIALLVVAAWVAILVAASLLAVIPFFLIGLAGRIADLRAERAAHGRASRAASTSEPELWAESERSHASLFESPAENYRRAG